MFSKGGGLLRIFKSFLSISRPIITNHSLPSLPSNLSVILRLFDREESSNTSADLLLAREIRDRGHPLEADCGGSERRQWSRGSPLEVTLPNQRKNRDPSREVPRDRQFLTNSSSFLQSEREAGRERCDRLRSTRDSRRRDASFFFLDRSIVRSFSIRVKICQTWDQRGTLAVLSARGEREGHEKVVGEGSSFNGGEGATYTQPTISSSNSFKVTRYPAR